jgi:two-component system, chemotaxis family, CheB/CheR fusion protein
MGSRPAGRVSAALFLRLPVIVMAAESGAQSLDGVRVLLVEDAQDILDMLAYLLRMEGAVVRTAASAQQAVEAAATWDFDALLTDIGLPDVPGDVLIREILGMKTQKPRIVAITGFGEPYVARTRRAGADVVFTKPIDWVALREQLVGHASTVAA